MGPREKIEAKKLLRNTAAWYHQALLEDRKAQQALAALGLTDVTLYSDFRIGFCNGTLKETVPPQGELRGGLEVGGNHHQRRQGIFPRLFGVSLVWGR